VQFAEFIGQVPRVQLRAFSLLYCGVLELELVVNVNLARTSAGGQVVAETQAMYDLVQTIKHSVARQ
jgi:hypothetical protein